MKRILVAPLDWGLGHTARCIPLIKELLNQKAEVVVAGNKRQLSFISSHFEKIQTLTLFGYDVNYSAIWPQWVKVGFQSIRLKKVIQREHEWLSALLNKDKFDIVISDNRFGLYSEKVKSIFITHQLNVPSPIFKRQVNTINEAYIKNFDECWIPDSPAIKLSGELSESILTTSYIGLLSRFAKENRQNSFVKYDLVFLLSGTEPQRSILEEKLIDIFTGSNLKIALVRGVAGTLKELPENIENFEELNGEELKEIINQSKYVACRSGYSSLMDLAMLGKPMFLIPTPGQPEQEYLAAYMKSKYQIPYSEQSELDQNNIMDTTLYRSINSAGADENLLQKEITRILTE